MARPPREINWDLVDKMIEAGSPAREIYGKFRLDDSVFYAAFKKHHGISFQDYWCNASKGGEGDLRLMLHAKAMQGNLPALTLLGKTRLGLREPDHAPLIAANQSQIDESHRLMELEHENAQLKAQLNANKSEAE